MKAAGLLFSRVAAALGIVAVAATGSHAVVGATRAASVVSALQSFLSLIFFDQKHGSPLEEDGDARFVVHGGENATSSTLPIYARSSLEKAQIPRLLTNDWSTQDSMAPLSAPVTMGVEEEDDIFTDFPPRAHLVKSKNTVSDRFCTEKCASRSRSPSNTHDNWAALNRWG